MSNEQHASTAPDVDALALDVARRFTEEWDPQRRASLQVAIVQAIRAARAQPAELAEQQGRSTFDVTDPWRGLYLPARMPAPSEYGDLTHPDIPLCPDDREDALDKLVHAQGFDFHIVAGDFTEAAMEDGDELYWEELRAWNPEAPEGEWRLAWKGDTEDGPYAWFVRPMALRPEPAALAATGKQQVGEARPCAAHCQSGRPDVCLASQRDNITCPHDSCDIDDGVRHNHLVAAKQVGEVQGDALAVLAQLAQVNRHCHSRFRDYNGPADCAVQAAIAALAARQPGAQEPHGTEFAISRTMEDAEAASDGMLPAALVPVADEWYRLCERRFAVDRIRISGQLAEAIVDAVCAAPPAQGIDLGQQQDAARWRWVREQNGVTLSVEEADDDGDMAFVSGHTPEELDAAIDGQRDAAPGVGNG